MDQKSGVSARLPISARELLVSQVELRMLQTEDVSPIPRLIDLAAVLPAVTGKVELVYEGEQEAPSRWRGIWWEPPAAWCSTGTSRMRSAKEAKA